MANDEQMANFSYKLLVTVLRVLLVFYQMPAPGGAPLHIPLNSILVSAELLTRS
uniref:Uncharacterized protein n=1 Tax=Anguilla anguilla TaxID=7936 RepID=A0A0E9W9J9_ANGAN